jgi:hypothetical protein
MGHCGHSRTAEILDQAQPTVSGYTPHDLAVVGDDVGGMSEELFTPVQSRM